MRELLGTERLELSFIPFVHIVRIIVVNYGEVCACHNWTVSVNKDINERLPGLELFIRIEELDRRLNFDLLRLNNTTALW